MEKPDEGDHVPSWSLRAGKDADFLQCAELWMRAVSLRDGTPSDPEMKRRALAKLTVPGSILSIAEKGTRTIGFVAAVEKTPQEIAGRAHLALLAVDPACQSQGLGRSLLANITDTLMAQGFTEITLGVLEENLAARRIYETAGWQATGRGVFKDSGRPCIHYLLRPKAMTA